MSDLITDGKVLIEWLTEDLSSGKSVQSSKWRDLWARLIEGSYSDDQAEFLFQRVTAIGRQFGALGTFKVRASEGRRVWRYAKQHKENVLGALTF